MFYSSQPACSCDLPSWALSGSENKKLKVTQSFPSPVFPVVSQRSGAFVDTNLSRRPFPSSLGSK